MCSGVKYTAAASPGLPLLDAVKKSAGGRGALRPGSAGMVHMAEQGKRPHNRRLNSTACADPEEACDMLYMVTDATLCFTGCLLRLMHEYEGCCKVCLTTTQSLGVKTFYILHHCRQWSFHEKKQTNNALHKDWQSSGNTSKAVM